MSTEIHEADSFLQQALQLSNLNDSYIERQNHSETILSDNGNETIMNKIDSFENKIKQITDINQQFQIEIDKLKFDLDMSLKAVDTPGKGINKLEQYNRRENVEIIGLPDPIKNVELEDVVINILRRIGVYHLGKWEIVGCHRLKKNPGGKSSNVIIRFVNRKRASQCLQNR